MTDTSPAPHRPFPPFADWLAVDFDERPFARASARFTRFTDDVGPDEVRRVVEVATRWAAVDTGAIEGLYDVDRGFTFTVALGAAAWDNMHLAKGEATRAVEEALTSAVDVVAGQVLASLRSEGYSD